MLFAIYETVWGLVISQSRGREYFSTIQKYVGGENGIRVL